MLKRLGFILLTALFFLACKPDKNGNKSDSKTAEKKEVTKVTKQTFDFSSSANALTAEWTEFKLLTKRINDIIKEYNKTSVESLDVLSADINSAEKEIPEKLQNLSLNARLTVLKTQVGLYKDFVADGMNDDKQNVEHIHQIIDAYNHTVFQINDIVEKLETEEKYKDLQ